MREVEAKFLEINRKELEKKLKSLGAKKVFNTIIENYLYDFPNNQLSKKDHILRLRSINNKKELTFKKAQQKRAKVKIREELNLKISDIKLAQKILKLLGLKEIIKGKKRRIRYKTKDAQFEFDKYLGKYSYVPEFLEIEATEKTIEKYRKLLGLKKGTKYSFHELIKIYKK